MHSHYYGRPVIYSSTAKRAASKTTRKKAERNEVLEEMSDTREETTHRAGCIQLPCKCVIDS